MTLLKTFQIGLLGLTLLVVTACSDKAAHENQWRTGSGQIPLQKPAGKQQPTAISAGDSNNTHIFRG